MNTLSKTYVEVDNMLQSMYTLSRQNRHTKNQNFELFSDYFLKLNGAHSFLIGTKYFLKTDFDSLKKKNLLIQKWKRICRRLHQWCPPTRRADRIHPNHAPKAVRKLVSLYKQYAQSRVLENDSVQFYLRASTIGLQRQTNIPKECWQSNQSSCKSSTWIHRIQCEPRLRDGDGRTRKV